MEYFTAKAASKYPFYPDEIFNWDQVNVGKETKGPQYCEQINLCAAAVSGRNRRRILLIKSILFSFFWAKTNQIRNRQIIFFYLPSSCQLIHFVRLGEREWLLLCGAIKKQTTLIPNICPWGGINRILSHFYISRYLTEIKDCHLRTISFSSSAIVQNEVNAV